MPVRQSSLEFPIRKSSRSKVKSKQILDSPDKENFPSSQSFTQLRSRSRQKLVDDNERVPKPNDIHEVLRLQGEVTPKKIDRQRKSTPSKRKGLYAESSSPCKKASPDGSSILKNVLTPRKDVNGSSNENEPRRCSVRKQLMMDMKQCKQSCDPADVHSSPRKTSAEPHAGAKYLSSPLRDVSCHSPSASMKDLISSAKKDLNTQQPDQLLCRDKEIDDITKFLISCVEDRKAGSLYISGAPGTGKTAVIKHLLAQHHKGVQHKVFINSMTLKSPYTMYKAIAVKLLGKQAVKLKSAKAACAALEDYITRSGEMVLLVLDEMDQLDSTNQEVLYTIFEWPSLADSRLILIGIANALDLTDRILPRLQMRIECRPQLLHFTPYSREQIVTVIESRLSRTPEVTSQILDKSAVMYCARKVSAVAGDMRKALDICRRSIEVAQASHNAEKLKLGGTPSKSLSNAAEVKVGIKQVADVVDEVYGPANVVSKGSTFPLQQKLIACTLLLMLKSSKLKELALGKVHDKYRAVCRKRDVTAMDQSEFWSLCQLMEARGLVGLRKAKETRQNKISLKLDTRELEFALQDKLLITAVLESGL